MAIRKRMKRQTLVNRMYHLAKLISGTRYEKSGKFNRAIPL
jgi:hypothetical protein